MFEIVQDVVNFIGREQVWGPYLLGLVTAPALQFIRWIWGKLTAPSPYAGPTFWSLGRKYKISAVCPQYPDDTTGTGWRQEQYGRPDQWSKFFEVKSQLGIRHTIVPKDPMQRMFIQISRNGKEPEKTVRFAWS
jgi:hypothetical protein